MWPQERVKLYGEAPDIAALRRLAWYGARRAVALSEFWVTQARGWQRAYEARILAALCEYRELQRKGDEDDWQSATDTPAAVLLPMERKAAFAKLNGGDA
jgi:hypothetical protein